MTALIAGLSGTTLSEEDRQILAHPLVLGVILFRRNYHDYGQLRRLITQIRALKGHDFLITVDQEGGRVARFDLPFTRLPPLGYIGAIWQKNRDLARALAHSHGWLMAAELLSVGVDLSFAPVLDIDNGSEVIGDRAFAADPEVVTALADTYCGAMHTAGMKTTGKHFPGHGTVRADSHHELPIDSRSVAAIRQQDLRPFAALIEAGALDAVMMSHVIYSQACEQPAGFSTYWTKDVLRGELGFHGAIISDDLGMQAAECAGDIHSRYQACVEAGADLALTCTPQLTRDLLAQLPPATSPDASVIKTSRALKGQSTLDSRRPFWQQKTWVAMRRNLVELLNESQKVLQDSTLRTEPNL
jgi:beta-N-acetylhexosaminidase